MDENEETISSSSRFCAPSRLHACGAPVAAAHVHRYPGKQFPFNQEAASHLLRLLNFAKMGDRHIERTESTRGRVMQTSPSGASVLNIILP